MNKFQYYLAISCIVKNEAEYMPEWLEYHLLNGVEKFYIYDNGSTDNIKEILTPYIKLGIVDYQYFPGVAMQMPAYKDCVEKHKNDTFWLAVIDIDEFIVPDDNNSIIGAIKPFEEYAGIVLQWLVYGDSGIKQKEQGLVIERFKSHGLLSVKDEMCKTIINPRKIDVKTLHIPSIVLDDYLVNSVGEKANLISNSRLSNGTYDNLHINHYIFKSYEEFMVKKSKGDALSTKTPRFNNNEQEWDKAYLEHNHNDIKNDPMMDKYISKIYSAINERFKMD